jgi:hypothetical protein
MQILQSARQVKLKYGKVIVRSSELELDQVSHLFILPSVLTAKLKASQVYGHNFLENGKPGEAR